LRNPGLCKEDLARELAERDQIKEGLIAIFTAVEPCLSYSLRGDHRTKERKLVLETRKCTHFYHYYMHSEFGQLHVRVQSWFPFSVDVCLNGRQWLAHQMDCAGISYEQRDNCFVSISEPAAVQELCNQQLHTDWSARLDELLNLAHPLHAELGKPLGQRYYWSASQSEFATDLCFKDKATLEALYPQFLHHAIRTFSSPDVLRFLGRAAPQMFRAGALLEAISRGEFTLNGLRNRDLRKLFYPDSDQIKQRRRQSAALTRKLALLRAHGLIRKVSGTHRYILTQHGRRIVTALLAARCADVDQLTRMAA
jgi:hypothetical protein